jgi:hypothetical protein
MILDDRLQALTVMSLADLREEWTQVYREPAPRLGADLLRHGIAYRLQMQAMHKGSAKAARMCQLDALPQATRQPRPGAQLVRSWNGRTVAVDVTDSGYRYDDRDWTSLSAIARAVTGAHWSGPRFFGIAKNG